MKTRELRAVIKTQAYKTFTLKTINENQQTSRQLSLYLSWAYGRYNQDKFGQEVNWNWIDLVTVNGIDDVMGIYERLYNKDTPNASSFFVNT